MRPLSSDGLSISSASLAWRRCARQPRLCSEAAVQCGCRAVRPPSSDGLLISSASLTRRRCVRRAVWLPRLSSDALSSSRLLGKPGAARAGETAEAVQCGCRG